MLGSGKNGRASWSGGAPQRSQAGSGGPLSHGRSGFHLIRGAILGAGQELISAIFEHSGLARLDPD